MSRASSKWGLLGIPDHTGVMNVGGRIGAMWGPKEFRRAFSRLRGPSALKLADGDFGDASPKNGFADARSSVAKMQESCDVTIVVGGGHDHGYTQLAGVADSLKGKRLGCINIDAHLDVRKPPHPDTMLSGSPFYVALESGLLAPERFIEFGIQDHCNAPELWNYTEDKKVEVVRLEALRDHSVQIFESKLQALAVKCDALVVSLDLDAAAEAFAPGVSAPQADGFTSTEMIRFCEIAGKEPKVVSLGIFELNPEHDLGDRTSRLAATCAFRFLRGRGF